MDNETTTPATTVPPETCTPEYVAHIEYTCSNVGLLMPFVNEYTWSIGFRATIYCVGMLWCFFGIAIVADTFMCAIEKITSKTAKIKIASNDGENGVDEVEVKVWNDTVANLTLMALGSSAPEILLSCIEIVGNGFVPGQLGPSTIVGSAAFNLLVITAVCIVAIPTPDTRRINGIKVFAVTATFCIFAYVWLIIILMAITPGIVDLWEAIITFLFFPILVAIAYIVDREVCCGGGGQMEEEESQGIEMGFIHKIRRWRKKRKYAVEGGNNNEGAGFTSGRMNQKDMREFIKELQEVHPNLSEEDIVKLATSRIAEQQSHSKLWYRIAAARSLGGQVKLMPQLGDNLTMVKEKWKSKGARKGDKDGVHTAVVPIDLTEGGKKAIIEFTAARCSVLEGDGKVTLSIKRHGNRNHAAEFRVETIDGTAEAKSDYVAVKDKMMFEPGETDKTFDIVIIDDNEWEPDEVFFVKLSLKSEDEGFDDTELGHRSIMEVTIINDDEPGTFEFSKPSLLFKESAGKAEIPIMRSNGADGKVSLKWKTEDMCAKDGEDYKGGTGILEFSHGETSKVLEIEIYDDHSPEKEENFKVELLEVSEGAKLGNIKKTVVTIVNDDDFNGLVSRLTAMTNANVDGLSVVTATWGDQFRNAMNVNGGDLETASGLDYFMHFLTFAWKIIFACIPPATMCGGWLAFGVALAMIGLLTAVVGDLAGIFGCLINLKPSVVAITFVGLGTSLPDLFASKQAATQEIYADNCIGNVTGSNSVNVFLGLGLPWLIAAIYWAAKGKPFEVEAGSLGFSVIIYTICALICIAILMIRRNMAACGSAELGGNAKLKWITAAILVFLWFMYVLLSALQAYEYIQI